MRNVERQLGSLIYDFYYEESLRTGEELERPFYLDVREFLNQNMTCNSELGFNENPKEQEYTLPDGSKVTTLPKKISDLMDPLFEKGERPLDQVESLSLDTLITKSVMACQAEIAGHLKKSVILEGHATKLPFFHRRIVNEMRNDTVNPNDDFSILDTKNREFLAWIGGSTLSNYSSFESSWISRDKYKEYGDSVYARFKYV